MLGMSLVPDTPDAQRRVKEAFESIGRGTDTSGVVLELRRKDNGRPVWVQWWSRPDPGGTFTRTMLVDITERVLMEQEQARLKAQNTYLQEEIKSVHNFDEIVGASRGLLTVLENVQRVAATDATVLILGEIGHRQGADRAGACTQPATGRDKPLHQDQLRGAARGPGRERTVRPRAGRLQRRPAAPAGTLRAGPRRHDLSGRDRRGAA